MKEYLLLILVTGLISCAEEKKEVFLETVNFTNKELVNVMDSLKDNFTKPEESIVIRLYEENNKNLMIVTTTIYSQKNANRSQMITSFKGFPVLIYIDGYEEIFSAKPELVDSEKEVMFIDNVPAYFLVRGDSIVRLNFSE